MAVNGSLLCGTYQFAFRLIKQEDISGDGIYNEVYSRFTILTNPVYISDKIDSLLAGDGRINRQTNNKIEITVDVSTEEQSFYTHYQIAVVRRLDGAGVPGIESFVLPPVSFSDVTSFPDTYEYSSNIELLEINLSEITTEQAHIDTCETITIKDNRLFLGNIKYNDLSIPNNWTIDNNYTTVINEPIGLSYDPSKEKNGYSNDYVSYKNRGYFRDEVYRYAISYVDKYGNWSKAKVIDFSNVVDNNISDPTAIDFRFPNRKSNPIFDSDGNLSALGLRIAGIQNHPKWAIGFTILRAKRKKNILFQTPLIPTIHIQPPKAGENIDNSYPSNDGVTLGNFDGTLGVKEFFYPLSRNIKRIENSVDPKYECHYETQSISDPETKVYVVFPQNMMYNNNGDVLDVYDDNSMYRWNLIDAAALRMDYDDYGINPDDFDEGDYIDSKRTATFYASFGNQYYYERGVSKPELTTLENLEYKDIPIKEFGFINNGDSSYTLRSSVKELISPTFGDYSGIQDSDAIDSAPVNQKMGIIVSEYGIRDIAYESFETQTSVVNNTISFNRGLDSISNSLISNQQSQSWHSNVSDIVNVVGIANIEIGLSDTRYGNDNEYHEFISTGAVHMFSDAELEWIRQDQPTPITIDVFGGDCYISRHSFKISNSVYHLTYANDNTEAVKKWGSDVYAISSDEGYSNNFDRPIAVNGASQIIQLYLEGEVNADVISRFTITRAGNNLSLKEGGEFEINMHNNYDYMLSYSNENAQKLWLTREELERDINIVNSRFHYSNQKVFETNIEGFDKFNAFDYFDLEGKYGGISKLFVFNNRMYALQERAFAYIPINTKIIETSDSETLSIKSSDIIGGMQYISSEVGTTRLRSVSVTDGFVSFFDDRTKKLYEFSDGIKPLSDKGVATYFNKLSLSDNPNSLFTFYSINDELYFVNESNIIVYDGKLGLWNYEMDIGSSKIYGFVNLDNNIYVIGFDNNNNLVIHKHVDDSSFYLGNKLSPSVEFYIMPQPSTPVTFDNMVIDSNYRMSSIELYIENDTSFANSLYMWSEAWFDPREGIFKIKTLRNTLPSANYTTITTSFPDDLDTKINQRMRGVVALCKINWFDNNSLDKVLTSVTTKYRISNGAKRFL